MDSAEQLPGFSLRPGTSEDLGKVLEIENKVHPKPWTLSHFEAELSKPYSQFWVYTDDETDETVAAYIVFWILDGDCHLLNLAVDLPYRGLGLAKKLTREMVRAATRGGIQKATLEVRKSNTPALNLYQGLGYSITQVRKGFYSDGEDAYVMTLSLVEDGIEF